MSVSSRPTAALAARRCSLEERRRPAGVFPHTSVKDDESNVLDDDSEDAGETSPLLPIFSAEQLDALPVYNITHTIRLLLLPRCETTLTWEQLRSPQVSQFLVKPLQLQIRTSHFSKATLYALLANCLQFGKEVHSNPGNSGVSRTRATLSELLAIRLLREFSTRDLIDALSYDFFPLQGLSTETTPGPNWGDPKGRPRVARISTLEIAIRAQAKRFLAHPLVVQQLEAIWAGTIVFHAAADNFHRAPVKVIPNQNRGYGQVRPGLQASPNDLQPAKQRDHLAPTIVNVRRHVTLYNPQQASLLKLSRLRVPRYRQVLSTCSFAALLGLFVAVLVERSIQITPLEVIFWLWSAGFMLDEVVGFNEQGFSLYIMSFWNTFDLGILILLVSYYCLRLYGIVMPMARRHHIAHMAYDLLAANAVLLFPRLFSVLDHYRYFSQLLIAFRMMALDLVAVFVLIVITCSGFFVAFTLSFDTHDAGAVAYALFQMLMGFTPAAWENWQNYNPLGKTILVLFLFICHFLIVTILITVLTNSFMAIVQNANDEHQFVFAVNAISMVKSDALFSYVAPTNILAWALAPLRFLLPFRQFVRINRTVIKLTHFPILFLIYAYERLFLHPSLDVAELEPIIRNHPAPSTIQQDRALEEVFRRPFVTVQRNNSNVVKHWMQNTGASSPPLEQNRSVLERLETRQRPLREFAPAIPLETDADDEESTCKNVPSSEDPPPNPEPSKKHKRVSSTATMLFVPRSPPAAVSAGRRTPKAKSPYSAGRRTPKHRVEPRPILPARNVFQSTPNLVGMLGRRRRSSMTLDLASDLGDNKAMGTVGAMPGSFTTQAFTRPTDQDRLSRLMLARMNTLEASFRDMAREVKEMRYPRTASLRLKTKQKAADLRHTYGHSPAEPDDLTT